MKTKNLTLSLIMLIIGVTGYGQKQLNAGIGYFGETGTYPGAVIEIEYEKFQSDKFSTPLKVDLGFYNHPRNHSALFLDIHKGMRRYFGEGNLYLEQAFGIGVMLSKYNGEDGIFHVDDEGRSTMISPIANPDFMPSISFGIGYNILQNRESDCYVWLRPKIYWQFPFNNLALPHLSLQAGASFTLKTY